MPWNDQNRFSQPAGPALQLSSGFPAPQAAPNAPSPAAAAKQQSQTPAPTPQQPQQPDLDDFGAVYKYFQANGKLPDGYAAPGAASADPMTQKLLASGNYNPSQVLQAMSQSAQPPAGGPPPTAPAMATAPGTMPPPMYAMPQMFSPQQIESKFGAPGVTQGGLIGTISSGADPSDSYQKLANGQYVQSNMTSQANQALGLNRLPDFQTYLRQQQGLDPSYHVTRDILGRPAMGDPTDPAAQQAVLKQYLALQGTQSQGDQDATGRLNAANLGAYQQGQLGVAQQAEARQQQGQVYSQGQGLQDAAKMAALTLTAQHPEWNPEQRNQALSSYASAFPNQQQVGPPNGNGGPNPPPPTSPLTSGQQLFGTDLGTKLTSDPSLSKMDSRDKLNTIIANKGQAWTAQNFPAVLKELQKTDPNASSNLRRSANGTFFDSTLGSIGVGAGELLRMMTGNADTRQQMEDRMAQPLDEKWERLNLGGQGGAYSQNNALLRSLLPNQ